MPSSTMKQETKQTNKKKLIIFDFSGTLAHFEKYDPKEYFPILAELGLAVKNEQEMKMFGDSFGKSLVCSLDWSDFTQKMIDSFSLKTDKEKFGKLVEFFKQRTTPRVYDDAKDMVDLPLPKAILSTGARFLIEAAFPKGFEIFSPSETKFIKPDPKAFTTVLEKMGVGPEEAIMVGDEVERDLIPAQELGMSTVLIDRENKNGNYPGIKVKSLKEIKNIFDF